MIDRNQAMEYVNAGVLLAPGKWGEHSLSVARNAEMIAAHTDDMDSEKAYVLGLLHDIGRRGGSHGIGHIFDGYEYMQAMHEDEIARICMTHSFPDHNPDTYIGGYDCTNEQREFLKKYLEKIEYDDYDRLIQLCDAISLPEGACIIEKRLLDVSLRHGVPSYTVVKWKAFLELKKYFDQKCHCSIYTFLPNVMENSYKDLI